MNRQDLEKYSRQILFGGIGETGQEKLLKASAVLIGCGALGTVAANLLVRAGLGRLRIIDRDFVETSNLQRQTLFEEADAREALPKAVAAERRLRARPRPRNETTGSRCGFAICSSRASPPF